MIGILAKDLQYHKLLMNKVTGSNENGEVGIATRFTSSALTLKVDFDFTEQQITYKYFNHIDLIS